MDSVDGVIEDFDFFFLQAHICLLHLPTEPSTEQMDLHWALVTIPGPLAALYMHIDASPSSFKPSVKQDVETKKLFDNTITIHAYVILFNTQC